MNWWEETEARAHRTRSSATLAQALWQRCQSAGLDPVLSHCVCYDLGHLHDLCVDMVKLTEGLLVIADHDPAGARRQFIVLGRWAELAQGWTDRTAAGFNSLLDSLALEPDQLADRAEVRPADLTAAPQELAKMDGRYRHWHLLYERLDLKLTAWNLDAVTRYGLARALARVYEESLITIRMLTVLEKQLEPRFSHAARMLVELNTTWHFDLGPYVLGHGTVRPKAGSAVGLRTWLLLAAAQRDPGNPKP